MKKTCVLCLSLVLFTACGTSSGSSASVVCDQQYWNSIVAVCLPKGWNVLSRENLESLGVPEETVTAFQYETPHAGQVDTVVVVREPLSDTLTTPQYSDANVLSVSTLPDYKLLNKKTVTIDGSETALHVFTARPSADKPIRRYYMLSAVSEKVGYTFGGSFPLSIEDKEASSVEFILKNVSFKDPKALEKK